MNLKEVKPQVLNSLPQDNHFTYEHFAKQPEYIQVNQELVRRLFSFLPTNFLHVDVATGTGLVPKLLIEACPPERTGTIIGIDPNATSLAIARQNVVSTDRINVDFIEGFGQNLKMLLAGKLPNDGVDSVSIHDALHEIRDEQDKVTTVQSMADILKPGGVFSFNSAFTTEAMKGEARSWGVWKFTAMKILKAERDKQANSITIHTPDKYKSMLIGAGLNIIHEAQKQVMLSRDALKAISKYPAFAIGVFEDMIGQEAIPVENKSNALIQALDERKIVQLPRIWYELVAQKPHAISLPKAA